MSDELVRVYIEDYGRGLGVAAYPARANPRPIDPLLNAGICEVPREQVERWVAAEEAWEAAQAEMLPILKARRQEIVDATATFAGFAAARRMDARTRRRP